MNPKTLLGKVSPRRVFDLLDADAEESSDHVIDYTQYTNNQLVVLPLAALVLALLVLVVSTALTGVPVPLGTEFTGGTELTLQTTDSVGDIRDSFSLPVDSVTPVATSADTYVVTFQSQDISTVTNEATSASYSVEAAQTISPTFGSNTQRLAGIGILVAFTAMSLLILLVFRTWVPSLSVVLSAFSDIMIPLAMMRLLNIELTLGTVAGLLMLIGYSVDSDILLTTSVIRRSGGFYTSTYRAMRTGVTMTLTSISGMVVMAVVASLFGIQLLASIGLILTFGLVADLFNTYLMNVALLRYNAIGWRAV